MKDFDEDLSFPSFDTGPEAILEVTKSVCKKPKAEAAHPTVPQQYYHDTSGDMQFFKYNRLEHVPIYRLASNHIIGLDSDDQHDLYKDRQERVSIKASNVHLSLFSKKVRNAVSRRIQEDCDGNILLFDYDDSMITSIYDPELVKRDDLRMIGEELERNPHNVSAWIHLIHEQQQQQQINYQLSEKAVLERKQAILKKALTANAGNTELLKEYISVHELLNDPLEAVKLVERLVKSYPSLISFYFDYQIHNSRTFSVFQVQERFEGVLDQFEYVKFLFDSGYTERAIRIIDYLWKMHYNSVKVSSDDWWEGQEVVPLDIYMPPPIVDSAFEHTIALMEWLKVESYRSYKFATPRLMIHQYIDEPEEDPDRIVCIEDVHMFTFLPTIDDIFGLFGFDSSVPHPFILVDYLCFDYVRKTQAVSTIPSDLKKIMSIWCLDAIEREPLVAAFHYLVLSNGDMDTLNGNLGLEVLEAQTRYLCCEGRFADAHGLASQGPKNSQTILLLAEVFIKVTGHVGLEWLSGMDDAVLLPYKTYLQDGVECMARQLIDTSHWHSPGVLSLLLYSNNKLLLPVARSWLIEHQSTSRFAFDAFVQFEHKYSSSLNVNRMIKQTDDDYRMFVLFMVKNGNLVRRSSKDMKTMFQAVLSIIHSLTKQECVACCLQAIHKHPAAKQVYMAAIDKLCEFEDFKTALNVLTVLQERGIRCRTLLEELC